MAALSTFTFHQWVNLHSCIEYCYDSPTSYAHMVVFNIVMIHQQAMLTWLYWILLQFTNKLCLHICIEHCYNSPTSYAYMVVLSIVTIHQQAMLTWLYWILWRFINKLCWHGCIEYCDDSPTSYADMVVVNIVTIHTQAMLTPPKGGRGCLMSPHCLESQGCHLIPLCYLLSCSSA